MAAGVVKEITMIESLKLILAKVKSPLMQGSV